MPKKAEPTGFARRLKQLREAAGLTQEELAERAGMYKFSVAKLEQEVREPTWATVLTLAKVLGVSVAAFAPTGEPAPIDPDLSPVPQPTATEDGAETGRESGGSPTTGT
jgi:transcriptional regulator with XRE-family HTH domain